MEKTQILRALRGSRLFGTWNEQSDWDYHGVYTNEVADLISLEPIPEFIQDEKGDDVSHRLDKFFRLALKGDPIALEMLFTPEEYFEEITAEGRLLLNLRYEFITKETYHTFKGYAKSQLNKARGQNKKVHSYDRYVNEEGVKTLCMMVKDGYTNLAMIASVYNQHIASYIASKLGEFTQRHRTMLTRKEFVEILCGTEKQMLPPVPADYCYWVNADKMANGTDMPFRPSKANVNAETLRASRVEHCGHVYRVYDGGECKLFLNGRVQVSSIPIEDEIPTFKGVMMYNKDMFDKASKEYRSFWEWMANRNEERWVSQDNGDLDYDCKNVSHLVRLLMSCKRIFTIGEPLIVVKGDDLTLLKSIREGELTYENVMEIANTLEEELDNLYKETTLKNRTEINYDLVNKTYKQIMLGVTDETE